MANPANCLQLCLCVALFVACLSETVKAKRYASNASNVVKIVLAYPVNSSCMCSGDVVFLFPAFSSHGARTATSVAYASVGAEGRAWGVATTFDGAVSKRVG